MLLPWADDLRGADAELASKLTSDTIADIVAQVPDAWLEGPDAFADAATQRAAYRDYLVRRLAHREAFVGETERARG